RAIVAVRVVVAALAAAELVASRDHRQAGREQECAEQVADRLLSGGDDTGVVALALDAVVERIVVVRAVAIVLAVAEVVLLVVGDEIRRGEAVVRGDEVHAREWTTLGREGAG